MVRQNVYAGNFYAADMTVSAVRRAHCAFENGKSYLEFGCSSAPCLRNLAAFYPGANWYGCDPVPESIVWAQAHFPQLHLSCSPQWPKLDFNDATFSGALAISVWSHFSERAALAWFDEFHRIIEPGGFLVFTTHGYRSLYYYLIQGWRDPPTIGKLLSEMLRDDFSFHPIFSINGGASERNLVLDDWGDCYFTPDWVLKNLLANWRLADFQPGRNQSNQDVYVLRRK